MPLSSAEIGAYLSTVTYKPGWKFSVSVTEYEGVQIRIETTLPNSYAPESSIDLGINSYLPRVRDVEELRRWLMWRLGRIEMHEMREWFKENGVVVDDPHGEEKSSPPMNTGGKGWMVQNRPEPVLTEEQRAQLMGNRVVEPMTSEQAHAERLKRDEEWRRDRV